MLYRYQGIVIAIALLVAGALTGRHFYRHYSYEGVPEISIDGIKQDGHYQGVVKAYLQSTGGYKVATCSVQLDDKPFEIKGTPSVRSRSFSLPFELDTKTLTDGKHIFTIEATDASAHANKMKSQIEFYIDNTPLQAAMAKQEYVIDQGHTFHPKIQLNKHVASAKISIFSNEFDCFPETEHSNVYECFIPVDCEQNAETYPFTVKIVDHFGQTVNLAGTTRVNAVDFPRQKGFHVSQSKLEEEKEVSMNTKILNDALEQWAKNSPKTKLWIGSFELPCVVKRYSTPFGEIRVTTEKGRYLHRAVDIINTPRSVVWASQTGKVIIKDRYLLSGNTVVLDHGMGVFTLYFHLEDFAELEVGDLIKKGAPVGKLGMTGYANGYHLHWELRVNNVAVEPIEWTKPGF